jgi:ABC-type Fe3+-hydroxamate transport system substrate-binding protein
MDAIYNRLRDVPKGSTVIHGGARGVDIWADAFAWDLDLHVETWKPDWDAYGKAAGLIRNRAMLNSKPDLVLAFWNGSSRGTLDTIEQAKKKGIPCEVIPIEPPEGRRQDLPARLAPDPPR